MVFDVINTFPHTVFKFSGRKENLVRFAMHPTFTDYCVVFFPTQFPDVVSEAEVSVLRLKTRLVPARGPCGDVLVGLGSLRGVT